MPVLGAIMVPHPPIILPEVGNGEEKKIEKTTEAYVKAAKMVAELEPETIIVLSPHSVMYSDYFHISPGSGAKGDMGSFRAPEVKFRVKYDKELVDKLSREALHIDFPAGVLGEKNASLDHGTMVPLYFINKEYKKEYSLVRIGLSGLTLPDHYRFGQLIQRVCDELGRRVVIVGSGDLSHKLLEEGPYGFVPEGPKYDERIMDVMGRGAFNELFDFEESFCDKAAECGHRSFCIMAGTLDGYDLEIEELSHEGTFGVGYGICTYRVKYDRDSDQDSKPDKEAVEEADKTKGAEADNDTDKRAGREEDKETAEDTDKGTDKGSDNKTAVSNKDREFLRIWEEKKDMELTEKRKHEDPYVGLARDTIESYVREGRKPSLMSRIYDDIPDEMRKRKAGVFVSIHKEGSLRGCIGTISSVYSCIGQEIIENAVAAATRDPRFDPIKTDELSLLEINVDVLSDAEDISSKDELDVKRYGVIVTKGFNRGLLLPNLDGVDTVDEQVSIALRKAGLKEDEEGYSLQRFEVVRHI